MLNKMQGQRPIVSPGGGRTGRAPASMIVEGITNSKNAEHTAHNMTKYHDYCPMTNY